MTIEARRKISLSERDAAHTFEWIAALMAANPDLNHCPQCVTIHQRLRKFIGARLARRIEKLVAKHPYAMKIHHHAHYGA